MGWAAHVGLQQQIFQIKCLTLDGAVCQTVKDWVLNGEFEYIIKNKWIIIVHTIPQKVSLPPIISEKINFEWIGVCMSSDIQGIEHPLFVNEQKLMTIFIIINF